MISKYNCRSCGDTFANLYVVRLNADGSVEVPTFSCRVCRCKFYEAWQLEEHFYRVHKCEGCGDIVPSLQEKAFHIRRHHQEAQLERLNEQQKREN